MDAIEMWELWEAENWSRLDTIARSTRQGRLYCCCFGFVFFATLLLFVVVSFQGFVPFTNGDAPEPRGAYDRVPSSMVSSRISMLLAASFPFDHVWGHWYGRPRQQLPTRGR